MHSNLTPWWAPAVCRVVDWCARPFGYGCVMTYSRYGEIVYAAAKPLVRRMIWGGLKLVDRRVECDVGVPITPEDRPFYV